MTPLRALIWCAVSTKAQTNEDRETIPIQRRDGLAWCDANHCEVIDILEVPGHSRRYIDIHDCARDMAAQGIDAFYKLIDYWNRRAFDVLVVRDGDRFARTQSLHAYVVERTIEVGARIYSLNDGWIDESNYRMFISMSGYKAASSIDSLVKMRSAGLQRRVERGLHMTHIPFTHSVVRNPENGRAVCLEVREELRRVFDDAATLLLEGVGWTVFSHEMYRRFGHAKDGRAYHQNVFYRMFYCPYTWGYAARGYKHKKGLWAFDETIPLPEGVTVNRSPDPPVPAVYTGELAERLKAELRRRVLVTKGHASPRLSHKFTGLLICADCGRRMTVNNLSGSRTYWRCVVVDHRNPGEKCTNRTMLHDSVAAQQIGEFLAAWIALKRSDIEAVLNASSDTSQESRRTELLQREIDELTEELDRLINAQKKEALAVVRERYALQIDETGQRLEILYANLKEAQQTGEPADVIIARQVAYNYVSSLSQENFWSLPSREINQLLHALMGKHRFLVRKGKIIDHV
jgi:DNA invertase Pin-like site-specific DNA recombinase